MMILVGMVEFLRLDDPFALYTALPAFDAFDSCCIAVVVVVVALVLFVLVWSQQPKPTPVALDPNDSSF